MRELRNRQEHASTVEANGTELYCEVRGNGSPVFFISGATGDAGHFKHVADVLADEFRVITYDRRGNSRSHRPAGWTKTSIAEQADDTAALLGALAARSTVVFGTSGGGTILVELICRHARLLKGAIAHEPVLTTKTPSGAKVGAQIQRMIEAGLASGGLRAAQELFIRWAGTDEVFEAMDRDLRERMLGNGEVFFGLELLGSVVRARRRGRQAGRGADRRRRRRRGQRHVMVEGADWLGGELGAKCSGCPGATLRIGILDSRKPSRTRCDQA